MIRIVAVGRMKDPHLAALATGYGRRIRGMAPFEVVEIKDAGPDREARAMLDRVGARDGRGLVAAMDERGEEITSRGLADLLGSHGSPVFLIGGADGLGPGVRERADRVLRLSALTLTHEMARVLLAEQIYRGLCILRNHPYHRG
jgi:23S rRNA (pseudouridine1915-N3)-methyltransferase